MEPVFIHSLWRAGSTYVWNRFRAVDSTVAFYEPFHEILGVASRDELAAQSPDAWSARHPKLDRGYYAEYLPLVRERGIPGFQKDFTVDHYFEEDGVLASEQPYLDLLLGQAERNSCTAVLACCRTLPRASWLKRRYGGTHIVVTREPAQQWHSGYLRKLEGGHAYFEVMPFQILGKAQWEPARRLAKLFGIPRYEASSFFLEHEFYFAQCGGAEFERSYAIFYALLTLSMRRALDAADLVIDIDRLSSDQTYRQEIEAQVAGKTGLPVAFGDSQIARHELRHPPEAFQRIERGIKSLLAD